MGSQRSLLLAPIFLVLASVLCLCVCSTSTVHEYSIVEHDLQGFLSEEQTIEIFEQWKEKHQKVYRHAEEAKIRFENFKRNLKYVIEKNANRKSNTEHKVGLNRFADLSNEEFKMTYLSKVKRPLKKKKMGRKVESCPAPSSLDWRIYGIVTGVKYQGECGSCWAFSSTGGMEGINALVTRELISLSEQELVSCDTNNDGCKGGLMDDAFEWVVNNGGIDSEADYPYTSFDGFPGVCDVTKKGRKAVSIDGFKDVEESDGALLCAVVKQPISVGMDGSASDFQLYTSGIYDGTCSKNPDDMNHAVLIVGYGSEDGADYWIVKNSWGTSWGMEGYFYIKRNTGLPYGVCAINAMASYPTKESSTPSPYPSLTGPPPPTSPPSPPPPPPSLPLSSPSPSECGDIAYCTSDETCCCILNFLGECLIYGCCPFENAVCCSGGLYCCPSDYPICDVEEGVCLQNAGGNLGIAARKRRLEKHKFPRTKFEQREKFVPNTVWDEF